MRSLFALFLLSVALVLLASCGDDGGTAAGEASKTAAEQASSPVESSNLGDVDVSTDGTTLILRYEDGSRLLIGARYHVGEPSIECFDEEHDQGPIVLSAEENPGVEELPDDVQVSLNLTPCST
jgi:hypothetical protein